MRITNRQLLTAIITLLKAGQLNETVLTMALDRPSLLVNTAPKCDVREFTVADSSSKYYINRNWFPMIREFLQKGYNINAIRLIRIVAGYTPERALDINPKTGTDAMGFPFTPPGWAPDCGLANSKHISLTGDFS